MKNFDKNDLHFSLSICGSNNVIFNGFNWKLMNDLMGGMSKVRLQLDKSDAGTILKIIPDAEGHNIGRKTRRTKGDQREYTNQWTLSVCGSDADVLSNYTGYTYVNILRETMDTAIGRLHVLSVNLDDREEAEQRAGDNTPQADKWDRIIELLERICDGLGV